jgi:hypothetical protein
MSAWYRAPAWAGAPLCAKRGLARAQSTVTQLLSNSCLTVPAYSAVASPVAWSQRVIIGLPLRGRVVASRDLAAEGVERPTSYLPRK